MSWPQWQEPAWWLALARRHALVALLPLFLLAVLATGWLRLAPLDKPILAATDVAEAGLPILHHGGPFYGIDLSGLSAASRGGRIGHQAGPTRLTPSQVFLFEDGRALRSGLWFAEGAKPLGVFLTERSSIRFSASDGGDPRSSGRRYTLVVQVPQWQLRAGNPTLSNPSLFVDRRSLWPSAVGAGVALALGLVLARAACGATLRQRQAIAVLCFAAVLGALAIEALPRWNDIGAMYDTASYMEPPEQSLRPPGYRLLAVASMTDPAPATFRSYPLYAVVVGEQGDGALRLVRAQKLIAGAALLAFGCSLAAIVAAPVAAALTLGIGTMAAGVPYLFAAPALRWGVLVAGVASLILAAAAAGRGRAPDRLRPLLVVCAALCGLAASGLVIEYGLFAAYLDWVQSEALALSFLLLTLAAAIAYLFAGWRAMPPAAAGAAALAALTHPGSLYLWLVVLGLLPVAFARGRKEGWLQSACVLAVLGLGMAALYVFTAVVPRTVQLNELHRMAFALRIAEREDAARMPDAESRAFLESALERRDARGGGPSAARRAFREHLHELRFDIGWPAALAAARASGATDVEGRARAIVVRAANAVLAERFDRYLGVVRESLGETPGLMRITYLVPWWLLAPALAVLIALVRGTHGYLAGVLVAASILGYLLIAFASGPIFRLTNPIDLLLYLACLILIVGAWHRLRGQRLRPRGIG
ncbi:MAG: hypothetical protein L6R19_13615 [Alphaproteobacteria bacterium]|nr:hypothetical protein [Alphaproteobacteria bacterium]